MNEIIDKRFGHMFKKLPLRYGNSKYSFERILCLRDKKDELEYLRTASSYIFLFPPNKHNEIKTNSGVSVLSDVPSFSVALRIICSY